MRYSVFNQTPNDATKEPMFFGSSVNILRYDKQKYVVFEQFTERQVSFFWRPEEVDLAKDRIDFQSLPENEKFVFTNNLLYQTLLDSIQGRSPNAVLLPLVSIPELETWIETWSFFEAAIHAKSYTHIIRNIYNDPSEVLDSTLENKAIMERATALTKYYDDLHELSLDYQQGKDVDMYELKKRLYLCLVAVYVLESIRFYVSFACSFSFAERKLMEGNAKIIKLIARDEAIHKNSTQTILSLLAKDDPVYLDIAKEVNHEVYDIFWNAYEQEKAWVNYLFQHGSMIGLNATILTEYLEYITSNAMQLIGLKPYFTTKNPIPWVTNWLSSDNVQVAPQETEISSYLVGQIDANLDDADFSDMEI